jgi:hypothetical protein
MISDEYEESTTPLHDLTCVGIDTCSAVNKFSSSSLGGGDLPPSISSVLLLLSLCLPLLCHLFADSWSLVFRTTIPTDKFGRDIGRNPYGGC